MNSREHSQILSTLQRMAPGQQCFVSHHTLKRVACLPHCTPEDTLLESIAGSGYEFGYSIPPDKDGVQFYRLKEPLNDGRRSYVSPDRRHRYTKGVDGLWHPKPQ